jgi:hypothetical protein
MRADQLQLHRGRRHLRARLRHRRHLAGHHAPSGRHGRALRQFGRLLRQPQLLLRRQHCKPRRHRLRAHLGATLRQQRRHTLAPALRRLHPRRALAAQLQRLTQLQRGFARVAPGVDALQRQRRIRQQAGLLHRAVLRQQIMPRRHQQWMGRIGQCLRGGQRQRRARLIHGLRARRPRR